MKLREGLHILIQNVVEISRSDFLGRGRIIHIEGSFEPEGKIRKN